MTQWPLTERSPAAAAHPCAASGRHLLVIYNPTAGGGRRRRFQAVLDRLHEAGAEVAIWTTTVRGDAERYAAAIDPRQFQRIVIAGGDGTVNEVINGLADNKLGGAVLPVALLPLGTANVLAAEIGAPFAPEEIARLALHGQTRPVCLGRANGRRFLLMAGAGFDAHVVAGVFRPLKRRVGKTAYVVETLRQFVVFDFPTYDVTIDGKSYRAASVILANARSYGGPHVCAPDASIEAPSLEVCLFLSKGPLHAIRYATALLFGRLPGLSDVRIVRGRKVTVRGPAEDPIQGDGDIIAALPGEVVVLPDAVNLVFPDAAQAPATVRPSTSNVGESVP